MTVWQRLTAGSGRSGKPAGRSPAPRSAQAGVHDGPHGGSTGSTAAAVTSGEGPPVPADPHPGTDAGHLPLHQRPAVRLGIYGWAFLGVVGALWVLGVVANALSLVVIPLVLALFPATLLTPPARWLKQHRVPDAAAAAIVLLTTLGVLVGLISVLAPQVAGELEGVQASVAQGIEAIDRFLQQGPFGLEPVSLETLLERGREQLGGMTRRLSTGALGAASAVAQTVTGAVLLLFALFFYLKDGPRIARWATSLFPARMQHDAREIALRTWTTIGSYFQGQLLVAFVDGLFIGVGLLILGVPLALPLGVLVFFGGLFPIVGAVVAGAVAVLVALATNGFGTALIVLALIIAVQQIEGNLLQPIVLGRATSLHPLAVIFALTAGALLLGVLGAFLAVPVAAGAARAVHYLRLRTPN